MQDRNIVETEH